MSYPFRAEKSVLKAFRYLHQPLWPCPAESKINPVTQVTQLMAVQNTHKAPSSPGSVDQGRHRPCLPNFPGHGCVVRTQSEPFTLKNNKNKTYISVEVALKRKAAAAATALVIPIIYSSRLWPFRYFD
jgi:hypothetical protein